MCVRRRRLLCGMVSVQVHCCCALHTNIAFDEHRVWVVCMFFVSFSAFSFSALFLDTSFMFDSDAHEWLAGSRWYECMSTLFRDVLYFGGMVVKRKRAKHRYVSSSSSSCFSFISLLSYSYSLPLSSYFHFFIVALFHFDSRVYYTQCNTEIFFQHFYPSLSLSISLGSHTYDLVVVSFSTPPLWSTSLSNFYLSVVIFARFLYNLSTWFFNVCRE